MNTMEKILQNIKNECENYFQIENEILKEESERVIEIPWALSKYAGQEKILDIGTTHFDVNYFKYFVKLLNLGVKEFHSMDIIPFRIERFETTVSKSVLSQIISKKGDIRNSCYANDSFDLIFCISTMEHIGFDKENININEDTSFDRPKNKPDETNSENWNEDYKVINELLRITKPDGSILLSVPFGKLSVPLVKDSKGRYAQFFQYNYDRIQDLLNEFQGVEVEDRYFYINKNELWKESKTPRELNDIEFCIEKGYARGVACIEIKKL